MPIKNGSCCGGTTKAHSIEQANTGQRVIYDTSRVKIQEIPVGATTKNSAEYSASPVVKTEDTCCVPSSPSGEPYTPVEHAAESCCGGAQRRPVKLRSIVLKSDFDSAAIVKSLEEAVEHTKVPALRHVEYLPPRVHHQSVENTPQQELYSNPSPTKVYDEALYSLENYLQGTQQPAYGQEQILREAAGLAGLEQTLSAHEVDTLTRYSSRTGVVSYPMNNDGVYVPEGMELQASQKTLSLSEHLTMLQSTVSSSIVPSGVSSSGSITTVNDDGLDNLFSVYLTSACAVPGGTCMCSENCNCPGCMKHGNVFMDEGGLESGFGLEWGG